MTIPGYVLLACSLLLGADAAVPRPTNPFPQVTPVVPVPVPPPVPVPDTTGVIDQDLIYAVQSDEKFILLASPATSVIVSRDEGPIRVRGVFAGGSGHIETKVLTGKYIAFVEPAPAATGKAELLFIPTGVTDESKILRTMVKIGVGPQPPPTPPGPTPIPVPTGFRVIVAYPAGTAMTPAQMTVINSTAVREYLRRKCVKDGDTSEYRFWDREVTVTDKESKTMRDLWAASKDKLGSGPQIIIAVDGVGQVFDLPATEAETLTLLKSKGGE